MLPVNHIYVSAVSPSRVVGDAGRFVESIRVSASSGPDPVSELADESQEVAVHRTNVRWGGRLSAAARGLAATVALSLP